MHLRLDFACILEDYTKGKSIAYVKNFGINYYEEIYSLLSEIAKVELSRIKKLTGLGSIYSSGNSFSKLVYDLAHLKDKSKINSFLQETLLKTFPEQFSIMDFYSVIQTAPVIYDSIPRESYVLLAGLVEYFCDLHSLDKPNWVEEDFYYLNSPICFGDEEIVLKTLYVFSKRNLFIQLDRDKE